MRRYLVTIGASALLVGAVGCGGSDGGEVSAANSTGDESATSAECQFANVDGPVAETIDDLTSQADVVALISVDSIKEVPDYSVDDASAVRQVASATVIEPVQGARSGDTFELFYSTKTTSQQGTERHVQYQGPEGYQVKSGDRLIVATTKLNNETGERELLTPSAFFVDREGKLDADLEALRQRCADELPAMFGDVRGRTTEEVVAMLREASAG